MIHENNVLLLSDYFSVHVKGFICLNLRYPNFITSRRGRLSESHEWHTQDIPVSPFFPNPDSYVSGDFTISPRRGRSV